MCAEKKKRILLAEQELARSSGTHKRQGEGHGGQSSLKAWGGGGALIKPSVQQSLNACTILMLSPWHSTDLSQEYRHAARMVILLYIVLPECRKKMDWLLQAVNP